MCVHRLYSPHNTPPHTLVFDEQQVKETNSLAGRARKIISDMRCRGRTNKLLLYVMIFVLVIIIGVVVYFGALAPGAPK